MREIERERERKGERKIEHQWSLGGFMPPPTVGACFSPINLRCYVLFVCK